MGAVTLKSPRCDLCGVDDAEVLFTGRDWPDVPAAIAMVRCRRCGLMYLRPRPAPSAIGQFYPPDYAPFRPAVEDERWAIMRLARRRKLAARRRVVERFAGSRPAGARGGDPRSDGGQGKGSGTSGRPAGGAGAERRHQGRVLDVGCSTGLFLREMALAGWDAVGVELTPTAVRYARERFGLEVFEGMLEDAPLAAGSFDAVTFWDVLEHVYSPSATLARTAELLRPGGVVAINVPSWDSLDRRLFGRHWQGYDPPRHLYVFTRPTLTDLLGRAGFSPLGWTCFMPSYFTFILSVERWLKARRPGIAGPVMRALTFPGARLPLEPLFWALNRAGWGSVITVVARKTSG